MRGRFIGDGAMLLGTAALAKARGKADESEILEVPADRLRQALAELPGVGEPIVRAFMMRRQRLGGEGEYRNSSAHRDPENGPPCHFTAMLPRCRCHAGACR